MTGAYSAYYDRFSMSKGSILFTLCCLLLLNYGFVVACQEFWTKTTFNSVYSLMLNRQYFLLVEMVEILNYLFVRTRTSIKYLPKFITITHMIFLMYVNSHMYPAQQEAIGVLIWSNLLIFALFINKYEMPAQRLWNPMGTYTPSYQNPRCGYQLVQSGSEFLIGFSIISMLTPLQF